MKRHFYLFVFVFIFSLIFTGHAESIQKGSNGEAVIKIQQRLIELGYLDGQADGIYGNQTIKAVKGFQGTNGLYRSGTIDQATSDLLFSSEALEYRLFDFSALDAVGVYYKYDDFDEEWIVTGYNYFFTKTMNLVAEQKDTDYFIALTPVAMGNMDGDTIFLLELSVWDTEFRDYTEFAIKVGEEKYTVSLSNVDMVKETEDDFYITTWTIYAGDDLLQMIEDIAKLQHLGRQSEIEMRVRTDYNYVWVTLEEGSEALENGTALDCKSFVDAWGKAGGFTLDKYISGMSWNDYSAFVQDIVPVTIEK